MVNLDIVVLTIDEYEAIRLADYENLTHEEAAKKMNISRPTFTRLLESAHSKISDAIINGKAIRIEGGDFNFLGKRYQCRNCGFLWNVDEKEKTDQSSKTTDSKISEQTKSLENFSANCPNCCPNCGSKDIDDLGQKLTTPIQCRHRKGHRFGQQYKS